MDNKFKYAKFNKNRKYANGGIASLASAGGNALGGGISNASYNSDGTVNTNQYVAGKVLGSVAAGASAGAVAGPWGAVVGGAAGLGLGLYKGITGAKNINEQAEAKNSQEQAYQEQLAAQKAEFEAQQQDAYNKAYYAANPIKGNQGSIYMAKGGELPKYPGGGRLSPSEWDKQNEKAGYMIHPTTVNSGKTSGEYKSYYDPNKFTPEYNADGSIRWTKNNDPTYNFKTGVETPVIQYTPPAVMLPGNTYMNDGTKTYASVEKKAKGGVLNPLASDIVKAEGATHAEGGIKLGKNGKAYAEVEDQEIIQGNNVYSDRITLPNSKITIAMEAEKLAKLKGKSEKYLVSSNYREKNLLKCL